MDDRTRCRASWALCLAVIVASLGRISLGATYSATGEQTSGGLPLSTLALFVCGIALVVLNYRKADAPGINIVHGLLVVALSASVLGLPAAARGLAVRELVQIYEILGFSYLVFLINRKLLLDVLAKSAAPIAIVLLLLHVLHLNERFPLYLGDSLLEGIVVMLTPFAVLGARNGPPLRKLPPLAVISLLCGVSFTNGGMFLAYLAILVFSGVTLAKSRRAAPALAAAALVLSLIPFGSRTAWDSLDPDWDETHTKRLFIEYSASLKAPAHFPLGVGPGRYKEGINHLRKMQPRTPHERDLKVPRGANSQYQIYLVESGPLSVAMFVGLFGLLVCGALRQDDDREKYLRLAVVISLASAALFGVVCSRGIGIIAGALLALVSAKRFSENERVLYPTGAALATVTFLALFLFAGKGYDDLHMQSAWNRWVAGSVLGRPLAPVNRTLAVISSDGAKGGAASGPGAITVEAESATEVEPNFKIVPANGASGDLVIESPNDSGKGVGLARYEVNVPEPGAYRLLFRVWWADGCSNSLAVTMPGKPKIVLSDKIFKRWHVVEALDPVELESGKRKLTLHPLEDGIRIDHFALVPVPVPARD